MERYKGNVNKNPTRCNRKQIFIYLFTAKSIYMFGLCDSHNPVPIRPRCREVAAVTVFSTPDDGCCDTRNM